MMNLGKEMDRKLRSVGIDCAEELMAVYNSLEGTRYTSVDDKLNGKSFRDRTQFILDIGNQGVWGDCKVYLYKFTGSGSSTPNP